MQNSTPNSGSMLVYQQFTTLNTEQLYKQLNSSPMGLDPSEVTKRIATHGNNTLKPNQITWIRIFLRQFKSPFIYILLFAAILAYSLGEMIDGTIIILFVAINAILGFYQEFRSEQAAKLLKKYTQFHAQVFRKGQIETEPTSSLVPGDIVALQPGDIIPADIRLLTSNQLIVDESILTGESDPQLKIDQALPEQTSIAVHEAKNIAFSGTSVVKGSATGIVIATGLTAYIGTIAKLTVETTRISSFEKGMNSLSNFILKMVGITLFLVFFANLILKGPAANIGDMVLFVIALAAAVIPEALPLVITFSLSRGAMRLAKQKVVVKRLSAIEDLGGIEILCTDKTGTITENKLSIAEIYGEKNLVLSQAEAAISKASKKLDPFDISITTEYKKLHTHTHNYTVLSETPFDPERKKNSVLVSENSKKVLIVRGAAESIFPYLKKSAETQVQEWIKTEESLGRRVLVVAHKTFTGKTYTRDDEESDLQLSGAISFTDPLKKSAKSAVKKAQELGISIKIITGDGAVVAGSIGQEIGLVASVDEVITAQDFFALSHTQQKIKAKHTHIFARFSPVQKYQLIELLQEDNEVGFMGDGINDAPALKIANVALVVQGATDIAREAADVILLNPSLHTIINGIQEGRSVFANTIKYVKMTLASNFGNFYAIAIVTLFIDFLPMLPAQILLVNLLTDFPLIAVATDAVDSGEIKKPESYNLKDFALTAIIFGVVSSIFDFLFFGTFYKISPAVLQTNWFIGSILTELLLLYSLRTHKVFFKAARPSTAILVLTVLAASATVLIPYTTIGRDFFHFTAPTTSQLLTVLGIAGAYFIVNEFVKVKYYSFLHARNGT